MGSVFRRPSWPDMTDEMFAVAYTSAASKRLQQLADASVAINAALSLDDMLDLITTRAREIIGAHQAIISIIVERDQSQAPTTVDKIALSDKYAAWRGCKALHSHAGICTDYVYNTNKPVRLTQSELEAQPGWHDFASQEVDHPPMRGCLAAPLIGRDGHNLGLILLSDKEQGDFTEEDEATLMQLAQMAAIAIENIQLYQQTWKSVLARDHLLFMVSHDLKNPLGAIKGYAQLLQREIQREGALDTERMLAIVNRIDATATRMTDLINELLDLSHLQISQPLELVRRPVDLIALIQQVVAEQQQTTHRHQLRIESAVTELVGDFDAARISRVIANLISNAIKYSPRAPEITVQIAREEIGGAPYAVVTVRDQGIGIPAEDLPYIFEQFRRAENVIGRIKGTGIGLASVRQIVEQHGGTITVESVEGEGSAFTVRLPLS